MKGRKILPAPRFEPMTWFILVHPGSAALPSLGLIAATFRFNPTGPFQVVISLADPAAGIGINLSEPFLSRDLIPNAYLNFGLSAIFFNRIAP